MLGAAGVEWPSLLARLREIRYDLEGSAQECRAAAPAAGCVAASMLAAPLPLALPAGSG